MAASPSGGTARAVAAAAVAAAAAAAAAALVAAARRRQTEAQAATKHAAAIARLEAQLHIQHAQISEYEQRLRDLAMSGAPGAMPDHQPPPLYRIVLTGGPCGGKTSALTRLKSRLEELGFLVVCVPETATMLFGGGVPPPTDEASAFCFQKALLQVQREVEDAFIALTRASGRPSVVLFDRGLMDGKAYMSEEQWELLLEELQLTPVALRDARYDAIVHLVTAADGAVDYYTLANNATRTESVAQALEMDRRTLECWTGHEHLYIVDNSCPFDEKLRRAVARISKMVGAPAPRAINRKFLLRRHPSAEDLRGHVKRFEVFEVESTYLCSPKPNERCRVRRRTQGTNVSFQHQLWVNEPRDDGSVAVTLVERALSGREYHILLKQADPSCCAIKKTLTCFAWGNSYFELNSFVGARHVAVLEVEAESDDEHILLPPMVDVVREVTHEEAFDSHVIASKMGQLLPVRERASPGVTPAERGDSELQERQIGNVLHELDNGKAGGAVPKPQSWRTS